MTRVFLIGGSGTISRGAFSSAEVEILEDRLIRAWKERLSGWQTLF